MNKNHARIIYVIYVLAVPIALGSLLTGCMNSKPSTESGAPNGDFYKGHPFSEFTELYYVGKILERAETTKGTIIYNEIGAEELPAYQIFSQFEDEYRVDGGAYQKLWQVGSETSNSWQIIHWTSDETGFLSDTSDACESTFLCLVDRADVCTFENDGVTVVGLSAETEYGSMTLVHSSDLNLLGPSCIQFFSILQESYDDSTTCSALEHFSPSVFYFYHQRHGLPPKNADEVDNRFLYYAYWEIGGQEYLLQFSSDWTDGSEHGRQETMRKSFQDILISFCNVDEIVSGEASAYFAGERSLEDAVGRIQSRARLYVNEQK